MTAHIKCTPELTAAFVAAIKSGLSRTSAASKAGIGRKTVYRWIEQGEAGVEPYTQFVKALFDAETDHQTRLLRTIESAAEEGTWQASAWILERRYPLEWSQRVQANTDRQIEALLQIVQSRGLLNAQQWEALRDAVLGARAVAVVANDRARSDTRADH